MPLPQQDWDVIVPNPLLNEQLACDQDAMSNRVEHNYSCFNPEQKLAFDKVVNSAKNNEERSSSFTALEVVERPMSATPLLLLFVLMVTLLSV